MKMRLRSDRLLLGLHGLALLRGWPFKDPAEAAQEVLAIRELCGDADVPPMSDVLEVDALDTAGAYASWSETYDQPNPLISAEEPAMLGFVEDLEPGLALDVATGTGRLARLLASLGHVVIAIDASAEMLRMGRRRDLAVSYALGDLGRLPFRDGSLDVVTCGLALTHVADLGPPIAEMARVVRPGGHVLLSDIHPVAVATGTHAFFRRSDGSRGTTRNEIHWPATYVAAFVAAGLVIEGCEEPVFDDTFVQAIPEGAVRAAARESLLDLPFALVWRLRREA
jgi:ubiquinone/menaquinone biosynthesis C-methylase UbiE